MEGGATSSVASTKRDERIKNPRLFVINGVDKVDKGSEDSIAVMGKSAYSIGPQSTTMTRLGGDEAIASTTPSKATSGSSVDEATCTSLLLQARLAAQFS